MSIITAIRISISIPFLFTPVLYNDQYYGMQIISDDLFNNIKLASKKMRILLGESVTLNDHDVEIQRSQEYNQFFNSFENIIVDFYIQDKLNIYTKYLKVNTNYYKDKYLKYKTKYLILKKIE